jgi:hypothetical protein
VPVGLEIQDPIHGFIRGEPQEQRDRQVFFLKRSKWRDVLNKCDYGLAREEVARITAMAQQKSRGDGGELLFHPELASTLTAFLDKPCEKTAIALLDVAPIYGTFFERCKAGGQWNESAVSKLGKKVFENSLLCAESLKPDLEEKFGKDSKEFHSTYILVLLEYMWFFLHLTNRYAFAQLGHERRNKLLDVLGPSTIDATIETYFSHWPQSLKDGIERDFYKNLNNREIEYASCKELLLKPEDDTRILEKLKSGAKSKSMVGLTCPPEISPA